MGPCGERGTQGWPLCQTHCPGGSAPSAVRGALVGLRTVLMSLDAGDLGEQKRDSAERETETGESPSTDASSRSLLSAEAVQLHQDL